MPKTVSPFHQHFDVLLVPVGDDGEKKQYVLRCKICHEDLSPANPSGSKNVDKEVCKRQGSSRSTQGSSHQVSWQPWQAWQPLSCQEAGRKLVAIKANLGSSEAPRGVDEMITLDHMSDSGSDRIIMVAN